jgi:hypothetical protein
MAVAVGCWLLPLGDVCCAVRALLMRGSAGGLPLGGGPEAAAVTLLAEGFGGVCSRFRGVIAGGGSGASGVDGNKGEATPATVAEAGAGAARAQLTSPSVCCAAIHWRHTQEGRCCDTEAAEEHRGQPPRKQ